jgi:hypothetical protein
VSLAGAQRSGFGGSIREQKGLARGIDRPLERIAVCRPCLFDPVENLVDISGFAHDSPGEECRDRERGSRSVTAFEELSARHIVDRGLAHDGFETGDRAWESAPEVFGKITQRTRKVSVRVEEGESSNDRLVRGFHPSRFAVGPRCALAIAGPLRDETCGKCAMCRKVSLVGPRP